MIPMQENGRSPLPLLPQSDDPLPSFYLSSKPNNHPPPIKKKIPFINQSTNATSIERSLKRNFRTLKKHELAKNY